MRLVVPVKSEKNGVILKWYSPSGREYTIYPFGFKGEIARLKRAVRKNVAYLAVGGHYTFSRGNIGWVRIRFVRMVRRIYRGVRPVKFDGQMPIYMATILPTREGDKIYVYRVWGFVRSSLNRYSNRMVCLYGTWFDFYESPLGMVSIGGIRGPDLITFPSSFKYPSSWIKIWSLRDKLLLYQVRRQNNLRAKFPRLILPVLKKEIYQKFLKVCRGRLRGWELRTSSPIDPFFFGEVKIPAFFPHPPPYPFLYLPNFPLIFSFFHL